MSRKEKVIRVIDGNTFKVRKSGSGTTKQEILSVQPVMILQKKTREDTKKQKEDYQT